MGEAVFLFLVAVMNAVDKVRKPNNHQVWTEEFNKGAGGKMSRVEDDKGEDDAADATEEPDEFVGRIIDWAQGN